MTGRNLICLKTVDSCLFDFFAILFLDEFFFCYKSCSDYNCLLVYKDFFLVSLVYKRRLSIHKKNIFKQGQLFREISHCSCQNFLNHLDPPIFDFQC